MLQHSKNLTKIQIKLTFTMVDLLFSRKHNTTRHDRWHSQVVDMVTGTVQMSICGWWCCSTSGSSKSVVVEAPVCATQAPGTHSRFWGAFLAGASPFPAETVRSLLHLMRATRSRMDLPTIFTSQSRKKPESTYTAQRGKINISFLFF